MSLKIQTTYFRALVAGLFSLCLTTCLTTSVFAVTPCAELLPGSTKGYVSIPDFDAMSEKWEQTQLGQLMADPIMKPFKEDLQRQLKEKMAASGMQMGISFADLEGVPSGEICFAAIQPTDNKSHAGLMLIDVTGNLDKANALIAKVTAEQVDNGATKATIKVGGVDAIQLTFAKRAGQVEADTALYMIHQNVLIASDHKVVAANIVAGLSKAPAESLATDTSFIAVKQRTEKAAGPTPTHISWFVEPFGYAEVVRAQTGGKKKRGQDILKLIHDQGFDAVKGIGGVIRLEAAEREILHHTFVYAPADKGAEAMDKYRLAARMLDFPNEKNFAAHSWVPENVSTYLNFHWEVEKAFWAAESLVDAYFKDEGMFRDVLESLKTDVDGPKVDIPGGIVAFLEDEVVLLTDNELPITPSSERRLFAIEIDPKQRAQLFKSIKQIMDNEPNATRLKIEGYDVWEIKEEDEEIPTLTIVGPGFSGYTAPEPEEETAAIPNAAITVTDKWLIISSHLGLMQNVLTNKGQSIANAKDYQDVQKMLINLGAGTDSFRSFVRSDDAMKVTYQMMRQNRMPEAENMLGKILNELWSVGDEQNQGRKQAIKGDKLPAFNLVEKYFGPAGMYVRSEDNGWFITGASLKK
ncbi:MAG: hypothetical protein COA78_25370 [Blastopirellula sp.]|nr:MAG: hypothetical protein COA78_25370 [Blastopirellula sp.]